MVNEISKGDASTEAVRENIINAFIQWARIRGYSDSTGFLRGLVVLAKAPVSLDELVKETGYSKSTVSSNMNLLESLSLVKRIVMPGDTRHLYAPIIDPEIIKADMIDAVNKEARLFSDALARTEEDIKAGGEEARYLLERVVVLRQSYEQCKRIIDDLKKQSLNEMHV
ncbi:MAG: hypothetical protein A4E48_01514 [Methanosaeta sp. PtaU1.Bin060]|nr:MAG: hypothetical protein A4E48_01514 [Methanosaeta sp. PtaU1.Bin060]